MPNHRRAGRAATSRDRLLNSRVQHRRILIVCEGEETEPNYFKALIRFHHLNGHVQNGAMLHLEVDGTGRNTKSLVEYAERQQGKGADRFDEIWCVFDKDSFPDDLFDNAIRKTENISYLHAAWTNKSFELWYILHFQYLNSSPAGSGGRPRDYYMDRLDTLLKEKCQ